MKWDVSRIVAARSQVEQANADLLHAQEEAVTGLTTHLVSLPAEALHRTMTLVRIALAEAESCEDIGRCPAWQDLATRHDVELPGSDEAASLLLLLEAEPTDEEKAALDRLGLRPVRVPVTAYRGLSRPSALSALMSGQEAAHWRVLPEGTPEPRRRNRSTRDKGAAPASDAIGSPRVVNEDDPAAGSRRRNPIRPFPAPPVPSRPARPHDDPVGEPEQDGSRDGQDRLDRDAHHEDEA